MKIDKFFHLYETENDVIFEDVTGRVYDEEWRKMHYKSSYNQGFLEGAKLCEQAQPEQRWIPCSERLPDEKDAGILKKLGIEKKVRGCPCHSRGQG